MIISDEWLPPPFIDWDRCSLRVPEGRIKDLPNIIRDHEAESEALGREARNVWERFFAPETQLATLIRGWRWGGSYLRSANFGGELCRFFRCSAVCTLLGGGASSAVVGLLGP